MTVYAKVMNGNNVELVEIKNDLGICIAIKDKRFSLHEDAYGNLILSSTEDIQLVISPSAANSVKVWSE